MSARPALAAREPKRAGILVVAAREDPPIFPGLVLSSSVFAFALFGDALRDVLDPRLKAR